MFFFPTAAPGTKPDKAVFAKSFQKMIDEGRLCGGQSINFRGTIVNEFILADSGFTNSPSVVTPYDLIGRPYGLNERESHYNKIISRCRV